MGCVISTIIEDGWAGFFTYFAIEPVKSFTSTSLVLFGVKCSNHFISRICQD